MAIDRSAMRKKLQDRQEESRKSNPSSGSFHPYIIESKVKTPWLKKIPEGIYTFDIIPFMVSENFLIDPDTGAPMYVPDQWYYKLDLWVHTNIGPGNYQILCPAKHFGKHCAVCEIAKERKADVSFEEKERWKKEVAPFMPKFRNLEFHWIHDKKRELEEKGPHLVDISYHSLEKPLKKLVETIENSSGESVEYAFPGIEGKRISFTKTKNGQSTYDYSGYIFLDRKEEIPDDVIEMTFPPNECIEILSSERVQEIVDGFDPNADSGEDEEKEEKPRVRKPLGLKKSEPKEEVKEEPTQRRRILKKETTNPCPFGHKYGIDTGEHTNCEKCEDDVYNACLAIKDSE